MTTQELIDSARKVIELDDVLFNIIPNPETHNVICWRTEIYIKNVIITLQAVIRSGEEDNDPDSSIQLAHKSDSFLKDGKVFNIPVKSEKIEYSVFEELSTKINEKVLRTEDDISHELKSILREGTITKILN